MSRILALGLFLLVVFSPSHCTARRLSSPALDNDTDDFWRATKFQPLSRTAKIRPESYVISFVPNLAFGVARLKLVNLLENRTLYAEFQPRILYEYTTAAGFGVAVSQLSNDILIEVLNGDFVKSVTPVRDVT